MFRAGQNLALLRYTAGAAPQSHCSPLPVTFTERLLQENSDKYPAHAKLTGMLQCLEEELHGVPLYYTLTGLAKTLKVDTLKKDTLRNALVNAGYCVSGTHCSPNGVKTDAPPEV